MCRYLDSVVEAELPVTEVGTVVPDSVMMRGAFRAARVEKIAGVTLFSAELELVSISDRLSIEDIETGITGLVCEFLDGVDAFPGQILWVNRTLLTDEGEPPTNWLADMSTEVFATANDGTDDGRPKMIVSWGNNVVLRSRADHEEEVKRGVLIAQALWVQLFAVDQLSGDLLEDLAANRIGLRRATGIRKDLEASRMMAFQGLCRDELSSTVQGIPARVAGRILDSWEGAGYRSRLESRIAEVARILELRAQLRSKGYQQLVEMVLFVIGLLTILQTVLTVVQTGFSGDVNGYPGDAQRSLIMDLTRVVHLDILMGGTTALMLLLLAVVLLVRRRSDA